jgi:antitoxin VapB
MTTTRLFKNGNSQAVRIPAELAFSTSDMELVIERVGEELRIRPAQRRMGNVLKVLSSFSPNFMSEDRGNQEQTKREAL